MVLFGALGILPTYATISTDYPPATGFYLIAVMNGSSCVGRILPGESVHAGGTSASAALPIVFTG